MKNYLRKTVSALLIAALVISAVISVCAVDSAKQSSGASNNYTRASQNLDNNYGYDGKDLGATYTKSATTFKVWAPTATSVKVNIYSEGNGGNKISTTDLSKNNGLWSKTLNGDYKNKYYTYTVTANDVRGNGPTTKETQDIYSVATGVNGQRSMVCDLDSTDPDGWASDAHVLLDKNTDSYVWEVHVKDFPTTANRAFPPRTAENISPLPKQAQPSTARARFLQVLTTLKNWGLLPYRLLRSMISARTQSTKQALMTSLTGVMIP